MNMLGALLNAQNMLTVVIAIGFLLLTGAMYIGAKRNSVNCMDLITNRDGKLDVASIGQVFGVLLAIWAPVYTSLKGSLDLAVFTIALTYLGAVKGFSIAMKVKQDGQQGGSNANPS